MYVELSPLKTVLLAALLSLVAIAGRAQLPGADLPIKLDAQSSEFDRKNSRVVFREIRVSQGDLSIEAERADSSELDFKESDWVFKGAVRISTATASLQADEAVLSFKNHQLRNATISGSPATFDQQDNGAGNGHTRGHANTLTYDFDSRIVKLSDGAWLSNGANEISGNVIVYNLAEERVIAEADAGSGNPVTITINPGRDQPSPAEEAPQTERPEAAEPDSGDGEGERAAAATDAAQ